MDVYQSGSSSPPVDGDWKPATLPYIWQGTGDDPQSVWFRIRLGPGDYHSALYLYRFSMNIGVWLNSEFLGDGGRFSEPIARNWNRPYLFRLPESAWLNDDNFIYIRLGVYPGWGGLAPPVLGPYDLLNQEYQSRFTSQITFNQLTAIVLLFTAALAFMLWWADRRSSLYAIFGFSSLAWSTFSLNNFVQDIPISARYWWAMVHSGIEWYAITLALFAHRLFSLTWTRSLDRILLGFGVIATIYYFSIDLITLSHTNNYLHFVSLVIALYLVGLSIYCNMQRKSPEGLVFLCCILLVVAFGIHDLLMNSWLVLELWENQAFYSQFSAPILIITMFVVLTRRFIIQMKEQIDAEQQIKSERERIFADIHDDVGSKVLSLVYAADTEQQADLARDALREIRTIVSGAIKQNTNLEQLFATSQAETQQRCASANIILEWHVDGDLQRPVSDSMQYHLQRIIRELISNCLKHANTHRIDVTIKAQQSNMRLLIRDYGEPQDEYSAMLSGGTGMAGIVKRAAELNGSVIWENASPGWQVIIGLPI